MAEDYREQWILHKGDSIQCAEDTYIISGDPIGFGGSSVVYPAILKGRSLEFAIKEYFPHTPGYFRKNGVIHPIDSDDELSKNQLDVYRNMQKNELRIGDKISNTSMRAVGIWKNLKPISMTVNGKVYTEVSDGMYSVLERMDKKGLFFNDVLEKIRSETPREKMRKTYGLPPIHFTACLMEQALRALDRVHQAGYLFGDIQGENVFFSECNTESGSAGIGYLIDFGSAQKLQADGYTKAVESANVFSTDGFRPPELAEQNDAFLRLGKQMDVYSAGCLMLRCVASPITVKMYGSSPRLSRNTLSEYDGKAIGCTPRVLQLVNTILEKSANSDASKRYKDAAEMLNDILKLKGESKPTEYLLVPNLSSPDHYIPKSRAREIKQIKNSLESEDTIFLWGLGGIGKTTTAIELAKDLTGYRGIYFIPYHTSMADTFVDLEFSGWQYHPSNKLTDEEQREEKLKKHLEIIRENYHDSVFIIDNFYIQDKTFDELRSEPAYSRLISEIGTNRIKFIFTTRYPITTHNEWNIGALPAESLLKLMRFYYRNDRIPDNQLIELINEVDGHTLTLTLIAKTLEKSRHHLSPSKILRAFRNGNLENIDCPEIANDQNRVSSTQTETYSVKKIHEHLRILFDISHLNENARTVLSHVSLMPGHRINAKLLEISLDKRERHELSHLIDLGWLTWTEDNTITIHPVICEICRSKLKPGKRMLISSFQKLFFPVSLLGFFMYKLAASFDLNLQELGVHLQELANNNAFDNRISSLYMVILLGLYFPIKWFVERIYKTRFKFFGYAVSLLLTPASIMAAFYLLPIIHQSFSAAILGFYFGFAFLSVLGCELWDRVIEQICNSGHRKIGYFISYLIIPATYCLMVFYAVHYRNLMISKNELWSFCILGLGYIIMSIKEIIEMFS